MAGNGSRLYLSSSQAHCILDKAIASLQQLSIDTGSKWIPQEASWIRLAVTALTWARKPEQHHAPTADRSR